MRIFGGHREKAAGREKGIDNWSPVWYFVLIKAYIVSLSPLPLRCVAGDKRNPVRVRGLPRSCICSCAALRRKAAIVGGSP